MYSLKDEKPILSIESFFDPLFILYVIMGVLSSIYLFDYYFYDSRIYTNELLSRFFVIVGFTWMILLLHRLIRGKFKE